MTDIESEKNRKLKLLKEKYKEIINGMEEPERVNFLDGGQSRFAEVVEAYKKEYAEIVNGTDA